MDFLINVKSKDAPSMLKLLEGFESVKVSPLSKGDAEVLTDLQTAVKEAKAIESGKMKGLTTEEALHELRNNLDTNIP